MIIYNKAVLLAKVKDYLLLSPVQDAHLYLNFAIAVMGKQIIIELKDLCFNFSICRNLLWCLIHQSLP